MLAPSSIPHTLAALQYEQRAFFASGATRSYAFRSEQLGRLRAGLKAYEDRVLAALQSDLRKPKLEGYMSEVYFTYAEIDFARARLKGWMKPKRMPAPLLLQPAATYVHREPYGLTLIMGAWNYPLMLLLAPLIGAIAAGNCAVLKPSELTPATSKVLTQLIGEIFPAHFVAVVEGDATVGQALLQQEWDYIFFTGSPAVGRLVAKAAAEHLTPVTLELGGKSPTIVDRDANLDLAAKRVAFGKFFNAGQTCVAPDYVLVQEDVKDAFVAGLRKYITAFLGADPAQSPDLARIVNDRHFDRLTRLLGSGQVVVGGESDPASRYIAPTVLDGVSLADPVMQEEVFGPILPVLTFRTLDDALTLVRSQARPLALYYFGNNAVAQRRVTEEASFGNGCINDTLLQFASPHLPIGGVGNSGMGSYHGWHSFATFSHAKSILKAPTWIDLPLRYMPYKGKLKLLKLLFK